MVIAKKKILVPLDGSKNSIRGLKKATELAKPDNAIIVGVHVVYLAPSFVLNKIKSRFKTDLTKDSKKILDAAKTICQKSNVSFEGKTIHGSDPGYDIVKFSQKRKYYMIVLGARGLNSVKRILLGSVSNYVLNHSKIPVSIVR